MRSMGEIWFRSEEGSTAVEFAIVGFPFMLLTIGVMEMALMFTKQAVLQEAAFEASRLIRTGQLQQNASPQAMFEDAVCHALKLRDINGPEFIPCSQVQYQVQQIPSFGDADDVPPEFDEEGNLTDTPFDPGAENDIVLIRLAYNYPISTPLMQPILGNHGDKRTMYSTVVLQTEPYQGF